MAWRSFNNTKIGGAFLLIDLANIKYHVVVMDSSGNEYNIGDFIQNLGWEENENEISMRSSFTVRNNETEKGYLSSLIKPGCLIGIFATDGLIYEEVARGYVESWNQVEKNSENCLKCTCYDELYKLQKSQDNRYYPSGTGTKSAIEGIFNDWEILQGDYNGPNASHGKTVCNNKYLSDIILEFLDDAVKKGEEKCIIQAAKGYTSVVPWGSNKTVYVFSVDNTQSFSKNVSTENLITRVKVVGQADKEGKHSVEATQNGAIEYGIRQRIYIRGKDETLSDANLAAQKILDEEGAIEKKMTVQGPDVPFIRKGDLVYIISSITSSYYYVKSIQHNADTYNMSMDLEYVESEVLNGDNNDERTKKEYQVGDIVNFHGGIHYVSSYSDAKGNNVRAGKAKITIKNGSGKAHPWHLIHIDSGSNVYGWVDDGTFD